MEDLTKKTLDDYPVTLQVREVAEILRINQTKAYELAKREDFPSVKLGRRIIIPKEAFKNWLEQTARNEAATV
ncbi:MAG: helix-turn-helix domain-containing protein [bacterium]